MGKFELYKSMLTDEEIKTAENLADMYNKVSEGIRVNYLDKKRLYIAKDQNPYIHYLALEINKKRWRRKGK